MFRQRFARFRGGMHGAPTPSPPVTDPHDTYLWRAVEWANSRRTLDPGPYVPRDPDEDDTNRDWNMNMWRRGLGNPDDENFIKQTLERNGLDVVLHIPDIPDGEEFLWTQDSPWWTNAANYNLMQIQTNPGPLWLNFIASDFRHTDPNFHFHISLCYHWELWTWFEEDYNKEKIREWIRAYRRMQRRYDGRKARLMGEIHGGHVFYLDDRTRVEGLSPMENLFDGEGGDPDVRYVHKLPGHKFTDHQAKSNQPLHVSLLID